MIDISAPRGGAAAARPPMKRTAQFFVTVSIAAGVAVVVVVARRLGADLSDAALAIPPRAHALALAAVAVHVALRSLRAMLLARGIGVPLSFGASLAAQLAGDAAGAVTPARTGSDPAKLLVLGRHGVGAGAGLAVMVGEVVAESTVLVIVAGITAVALPDSRAAAAGALTYAVVVLATTSSAVLLAREPGRALVAAARRLLRLPRAPSRSARRIAVRFLASGRALIRLRKRTLAAVAACTAVHMLARLAVLPLLVAGSVSVAVVPQLIVWPLLLLYAGALVPAPGGGGAIELGFATTLDNVLAPGLLVGALLWWRLYTYYLGALLGGVVLALSGGWRSGVRPRPRPRTRTDGTRRSPVAEPGARA